MNRCAAVLAFAATLAGAAPAAAQSTLHSYGETRVDGILGSVPAAQAGGGIVFPLGYYVRLGTTLAGGVSRVDGSGVAGGRGDVMLRFLLDPFRESRWGLSLGGGASVRWDDRSGWRPYLAVLADLEAPRHDGVTPAFQLGLGGGARIGMALRWSRKAVR